MSARLLAPGALVLLFLLVSAELEPPGGWVPVTLDVRTGRTPR